jgi:hypothetical protein
MVTFVAVPYQLYSLTGSTLQVGLLSLADAIPLIALSAVGGTIADRLDRRGGFWAGHRADGGQPRQGQRLTLVAGVGLLAFVT